jgi:hypothetical protein
LQAKEADRREMRRALRVPDIAEAVESLAEVVGAPSPSKTPSW